MDFKPIIKKIDTAILKYGIPYYTKKWKKIPVPSNFNNYEDFIKFLNQYVKSYHFHSIIHSKKLMKQYSPKSIKESDMENRPLPGLKYDHTTKIGTITFYHYYNNFNQKENNARIQEIVNLVHLHYTTWEDLGLDGIIIDLRKHQGGNMWAAVASLQDILGDTTLLSFNNAETKFTDRKWTNIKDGVVTYNKQFITNELSFKKPIAVLVSKNTASSGEFVAGIFYGRKNVKIFGDKTKKTAGYFSSNSTQIITNDIYFYFTNTLCTTSDGTFHKNEYIEVNAVTTKPINDAKKWILTKSKIKI
jgi:hypothetical protein